MGLSQARILEGVAISFSRWLPKWGIESPSPVSPAMAGRFFTTSPPGKPMSIISQFIKEKGEEKEEKEVVRRRGREGDQETPDNWNPQKEVGGRPCKYLEKKHCNPAKALRTASFWCLAETGSMRANVSFSVRLYKTQVPRLPFSIHSIHCFSSTVITILSHIRRPIRWLLNAWVTVQPTKPWLKSGPSRLTDSSTTSQPPFT